MKPLRYFFFRNYQLNLRQRSAIPWLRPLVLLSALSSLNVLVAIWVWFELGASGMTIAQRESVLKVTTVLWAVSAFLGFYIRWIKSGRYLEFEVEFNDESPMARRVRTASIWVYAIASLCAPAIAGYWTFLRNQ